ncbi:MAG: choline-sulfatase [Kiloniellales bacterium]
MKQPNILLLQVDQLSAQSLAAYGDPVCVTPTLDRLANRGVVFERAYCNFPLCAPARFSMASGRLPSAIGAYDNAAEFPASIPSYAHHLRRRGYLTLLSGKMHFIGPDQLHGFERRLTPELYPADFSWVPNWENEGKRDTNDARGVRTAGVCARSVQIDYDEAVAHKAEQQLYDLARTKNERPFFLQVSFTHPHEPFLCQQGFWDLYEGKTIPLPRVGSPAEIQLDAHSRRLLQDFDMLGERFTEEEVLRARRAYYGSISYIDSLVARVLAALKATGADKTTAVIFTSDHGEMLGERGLWFKKHFFERALRIPLLVYAPWLAAERRSELVSLVDLLPTLNGIADAQPWRDESEQLDGEDLTGLLGRSGTSRERSVYAEYLAEATPGPIVMIRRGRYKFVYCEHDPALLFDLETDPDEMVNLAEAPEQAGAIAALRAEIDARWNLPDLAQRVRHSQQQRLLIRGAMRQGQAAEWERTTTLSDTGQWYRGKGSYNDWAFNYLPVTENA